LITTLFESSQILDVEVLIKDGHRPILLIVVFKKKMRGLSTGTIDRDSWERWC
jgi:hypothetical protein